MNDRDEISQGIPYDESAESESSKKTGGGRSWGTGGAEGFSDAAPPESDAKVNEMAEEKSPVLAGLMAFLPGAGHIYVGALNRGLFFLGSFIALIFALNSYGLRELHPLFGVTMPFLLVFNVVDAVRSARAVNRAAAMGEPAPVFPVPFLSREEDENPRVPGWAFIAAGVFLLGVTRFDWDLDWLIDWWPVALIVIGVRMITRARHGGG